MIIKGHSASIKHFKEARRKTQLSKPEPQQNQIRRSRDNSYSPYESFKRRYEDLDSNIDNFKTRDFVYYFREVAEECGFRYTISNIKKDMAIFKRLTSNYEPREICGMIEFLYRSEQDYLDKDRLSPNILASQWINTVYADMQLWVNDEFTTKSSKKKKKQREWSEEVSQDTTNAKIGEWE